MINLEALQVFSIDDGAGGLVLAAWVESSTVEGVPKVPHTIVISNEEARLLAKELNAAVTPDEDDSLECRLARSMNRAVLPAAQTSLTFTCTG